MSVMDDMDMEVGVATETLQSIPGEPPQEKKIRREIANSNERRRMQSINSGFASLRTLLPHHEGEKLSKASILQQTAEYIYSLEQEKTRLLSQNCQLKRLLGQTQHVLENDDADSGPAPKRRLLELGQKALLEDDGEEIAEVQNKFERERRTRMALEERVRLLESQLYQTKGRSESVIQRYSTEDRLEGVETLDLMGMGCQTILTAAARKQGLETLVLDQGVKLPSIISLKDDGERVEVERIPELPQDTQTVEIANVQDPETGATRQYIVTHMTDNTSKQNLETIVEAIRHLEGDHLFGEESGPHQVVKEEVVESCIIEDGMEIQMTLASGMPNYQSYQLSLPSPSLANPVPVTYLTTAPQDVPVTVSNLISSLQTPLPQSTFLQQATPTTSAPSLPLELPHIGPPQTSPVNLELTGPDSGSPTRSDLSNSPPQSSPVNLAQPLQTEN